jgi:hypothetical protein
MGFQAISSLEVFPDWRENMTAVEQKSKITPISIGWFFRLMLPALVLLALAAFGIYRTTTSRHAE